MQLLLEVDQVAWLLPKISLATLTSTSSYSKLAHLPSLSPEATPWLPTHPHSPYSKSQVNTNQLLTIPNFPHTKYISLAFLPSWAIWSGVAVPTTLHCSSECLILRWMRHRGHMILMQLTGVTKKYWKCYMSRVCLPLTGNCKHRIRSILWLRHWSSLDTKKCRWMIKRLRIRGIRCLDIQTMYSKKEWDRI